MSEKNILSDQPHIDQIMQRLWCNREFGQAAVMVGAGFSRNAERTSSDVSRFPLWNDLAERLHDSLYPSLDYDKEKDALRLATEYEAFFGRAALDSMLIESIPDGSYSPGRLHELLLDLPWSDVFTTNYDTLLERSLPSIHERKYDVVLKASDIPDRMKPRIVKLHGSFPSERPFIITEEDYRKYPTKFAPYVNMVQQSIMENVFCLIGFSGYDPNFLYWSGWVRDNLGPTTPLIYLCGLLNLSRSERRVLESRNVIPIDLSPLFSEQDWPDPELRHQNALEWFLLSLMDGEPPNVLSWPNRSRGGNWIKSDDLPPIPSEQKKLPECARSHPDLSPASVEELKELYQNWRQERLEYPGWEVCPKSGRDILWIYTERWIDEVLNSSEALSIDDFLPLLFELNWRLETALIPLFTNWVDKIIPTLSHVNPYPKMVEMDEATIRPGLPEYRDLDWNLIGYCWVNIGFAIVRALRQDQDESRYRLWMKRLSKVVKQCPELQAQWCYNECLFHLFRFDEDQVRAMLEQWPSNFDLPFWEAKRASVLAELGDLKNAERIGEIALAGIRSRLQPYSIKYSLLSQEGWTMMLLNAIKSNEIGSRREFVHQYRDRWDSLMAYRCNPWSEIDLLELEVTGPPPTPKRSREVRREFDPGRATISHTFASGWDFADRRSAFTFLRMLEEGTRPARCGIVVQFSEAGVSAAKWISPYFPLWAFSAMFRIGKDKDIEQWFERVDVAMLSQEEANRLGNLIMNSLTQAIKNASTTTSVLRHGTTLHNAW